MARHAGLAERALAPRTVRCPVVGRAAWARAPGELGTRDVRPCAALPCWAARRCVCRSGTPIRASFRSHSPAPGRRQLLVGAVDAGLPSMPVWYLPFACDGCSGARPAVSVPATAACNDEGEPAARLALASVSGLWPRTATEAVRRRVSAAGAGRRFAAACGGCSASSAGIRRARRSFDSWPLAAKSIPYSAAPPPPFVPAFVRPFVLPQVLGRRMRRRVDLRPGVRFGRRLASAVGGPRRSTDADRAAAAVVAVPLHPLLTRPTSLRPSVALRRRCRSAIALERRRRSIECRSGSRRGRACASAISFGRRRLPLPPPSTAGDIDKKPLVLSVRVDVARAFGQRRSRRSAALLRPLANAARVPTSSARSVAADAVRGASAVADGSGGGGKSSRTFAQIGLCGAKRGAFRHRRRRARNDARNDRDRAATRCAQRNARAR